MESFFMAQICFFGGNFAPLSWAFCSGQLMVINQNTALFSLLGTTYGGNGQTTFGLPDFRGRIPVGTGTGPGLTPIALGEAAGSQQITLLTNNLPTHSHPVTATIGTTSASANTATPNGNYFATANVNVYAAPAAGNTTMGPLSGTTQPAGSSQPVDIQMPYLGINFVICIEGVFPSRN